MTGPAPVTILHAALGCRCPRCGKGALFQGLLTVRDHCPVCDLDLRAHDSGDGPTVLVIFVLATIVVALAFWVEFTFEPPLWVHAVIWLPTTAILTVVLLRLAKAHLLVLQYKHQAREGRLSK